MSEHDLDFQRTDRQGFPEVIYGEYKSVDQLTDILQTFNDNKNNALVTRLSDKKAKELLKIFPEGEFNKISETFQILNTQIEMRSGLIGVLTAGSSDMPVAMEASETLKFMGIETEIFADKGVAGIHRLQSIIPQLLKMDVIICVAGFEGALPSVVGGLLPCPIIAVPTSVGYGVSEGGKVALGSMLSSCSSGISVVNIDNGFGAAMAALRIIQKIK